MKHVIALIMFFVAFSAFAQELEINQKGETRPATEGWRALTAQEKVAVANPGIKVPLWGTLILERENFFFGRGTKHASEALVYEVLADNPHNGRIKTIQEDFVVKGEMVLLRCVLIIMVAMICMVVSNVFCRRQSFNSQLSIMATTWFLRFAFIALTLIAYTTVVFINDDTDIFITITSCIAVYFAVAAFVNAMGYKVRSYWVNSGGFYVFSLMAISLY